MTNHHTPTRGLLALLLAGAAIPAVAQETVTPPSITPSAPAPAAEPAPAPAPAASPTINFAPQAPVVQTAPPPAPPPESVRNPAPDETATRPARRSAATPSRAAPRAAVTAPVAAPVAVAPTTPTATTPVDPTPAPAPETAPIVDETAPAEAAPAAPATNPEEIGSGAAWAMLGLAAAAIIGGILFLLSRRRRRNADAFDYDEPVYEPVAEPIAAAPVAAAPALVPEALAVVADPAQRPWIDIGLRPIRAEAEGALQVEVTVSNSGDVDAHDVRVSTWMLSGADSSAGERALIGGHPDAQVATVDVAPGADRSVDTTLEIPSETASPMLVAEARYPLPDGGEGRIAATFEIEVNGSPENVEARLHDVLERA